ncbi:homoserine dehydrogenase [Gammaproteobacteria bacterium]|jgi:homoserine dehydrogenase|nr:homoserine dehydrogenase [Gammaproteobacteria bacterium]MDA9212307.1 homoserine dehydrogenase [Gammaproteobacteria bacterium]MDC0410164.1 homoserine dehydrogenase [Gammaproteobacteria bacterium]MDC1051547.1 homoserine dehydrogenase [Gammaproteobacteria bacterium]|tara:strand:+ start:2266 stop:3531 length:1266 start_codon:yes stop_codon:yes gene_type:complete
MKTLKVGICGWGNVATGMFNAIESNNNYITKAGVDINIACIGARRDNPKCNPGATPIFRDIFDIPEQDIDVVVELIGGVEVARELILKSIRAGKHVITANKAVIFNHGDEIFAEANKNKVKVLFEAAVCAGTPIVKMLKEELAPNKIKKISGMLNGTSNFILSNMEEGNEFDDTLELAQKEGYAEPDPSFDIEGVDAAHKIGLLSSIAYGSSLPPKDFYIEGITKIDKKDFIYAEMLGYTIKHLAISEDNEDKIELRAHPALVSKKSYLANLKGVRNGIEVDTDLIGKIHIAGSGAGQESTASGLISDIIHLANSNEDILNVVSSINQKPIKDFGEFSFQYYFFIEAEDNPGVMASITTRLAEESIGIESMVQKDELGKNIVPIILITDIFKEDKLEGIKDKILSLDTIKNLRTIRIESTD